MILSLPWQRTTLMQQSLGLFAQKAGAKVIANLGDVGVRAQPGML
ncbi:hypothetical protein BN439_0770 [Erwinia amylovora Ea644]|nr:hypothetical protein BN439_0770 [Erwinia amylovora Ea644]